MKQLTYVHDHRFAWNKSYFSLASSELALPIVGAWLVDQLYQWKPEEQGEMQDIEDPKKGVINLLSGVGADRERKARFGPQRWLEEVGTSKVLVGVGNPWWSPSPYHALCAGVPFINPVRAKPIV